MKVRSSGRPPILAVYVASSTTTSPERMTCASGSSASRCAAQPADRQLDPGLELGRAAGVQDDVVHAPVVGDDGEAALGDDQQHRHVGAGGADQPAQVAGVGEVLAAVDEDQVGVGGLEQRAALGGQDLDLVAEQGEAGQHLGRRLEGAGEQQQRAHGVSSGAGPIGKDIGA